MKTRRLATIAIIAAIASQAAAPARSDAGDAAARIELKLGFQRITPELAATPGEREIGLMHRSQLGRNDGMLFVYPQEQRHCMWMKNTLIPLDAAFIDAAGRIINIAHMQPLDEQTTHCAAQPARYVLEMNSGWFAANKLHPGQKLRGLENTPAGR